MDSRNCQTIGTSPAELEDSRYTRLVAGTETDTDQMLRSFTVLHGVRDFFLHLRVATGTNGCGWLCQYPRHANVKAATCWILQPLAALTVTSTVKFTGVSTLLFSDGQTKLLIDGFFSRPSVFKAIFYRPVESDVEKIRQSLKRFHINQLDAVLVSHSHYDHAMDSGNCRWAQAGSGAGIRINLEHRFGLQRSAERQ